MVLSDDEVNNVCGSSSNKVVEIVVPVVVGTAAIILLLAVIAALAFTIYARHKRVQMRHRLTSRPELLENNDM